MAKLNLVRGLLLSALVALTVTVSEATLLNDRFGVTPTVSPVTNWEYSTGNYYSGYKFNTGSLAPTRNLTTVDYNVNDWFGYWNNTNIATHTDYPGTGTWPSGSEPYDVEAIYFDDDGRNMYIAIVTSVPTPANGIFTDTRTSPAAIVTQGDIALDLRLSGSQQDARGFRYNYGIDVVDENRPSSGNVSSFATNTVGTGVYRTTGSGTSTGAWYLGTPSGAVSPPGDGARTNFDPSYSPSYVNLLGSATTSWYQLDLQYSGSSVLENNYQTWVIEATIPMSLFPRFEKGQSIAMQFMPGCRNDGNSTQLYMFLDGDLDAPEPGTWALLIAGLAGVAYRIRRRRK